jgi:hypothetical protein
MLFRVFIKAIDRWTRCLRRDEGVLGQCVLLDDIQFAETSADRTGASRMAQAALGQRVAGVSTERYRRHLPDAYFAVQTGLVDGSGSRRT